MAKGKTEWKQKKQKRTNSKLLRNAFNWQLYYITRIYSEIILIKILGDNSYSSLDISKKMGVRQKNTGKWEKYHDTEKILQSVFRQPGNPRFCF